MADSRMDLATAAGFNEVNIWMWRDGRGQPHRVTVAEAELQRKAAISDACKGAAHTMKRRREERGALEDYYRKPAQDAGVELPRIEHQWCYIACLIPWYIAHATLNAVLYTGMIYSMCIYHAI